MDGNVALETTSVRFATHNLPACAGFPAFRRAVLDPQAAECRFCHGSPPMAHSVLLNEVILYPYSMAIFSPTRGWFDRSVAGGAVRGADEHAAAGAVERCDRVALPLGGGAGVSYRQFLYEALPMLLQHRLVFGPHVVPAGGPLVRWQAEILTALDLATDYLTLAAPTEFRKVLTSERAAHPMSLPDRFIRAVFDRLRYRFGVVPGSRRRLLIVQDGGGSGAELGFIGAIAGEFGFETVRPTGMSVAERARLFAAAECVVGAPGADLADVGFCDPGTRVLALQGSVDDRTRAACRLFGLPWHNLDAAAGDDAVRAGFAGLVGAG